MIETAACVDVYVLFILQIFTVDESYKVELQFTRSVEEVERNRDAITRYTFVRLLSPSWRCTVALAAV